MSNVVSKEFQGQLEKYAISRFVLVVAFVLGISALGTGSVLIPSLFSDTKQPAPVATTTQTLSPQEVKNTTEQLKNAQALVTLVAPTAVKKTSLYTVMSAITNTKPTGIVVTDFIYGNASGKGGKGTLTVSGVTKSRSDIAAFRVALVKSDLFETVSIPVGVLVDSNASAFNLTMTGNF